MRFLEQIKVTRAETRLNDAWYDLSMREMRKGEVRFYRVKDFLTGNWLFKTCNDKELGKVLVKAVKCPAGINFAQLEGNSMVFQRSVVEDMLYDVISLTKADENDRVRRKIASSEDEIPTIIKENFKVEPYEKATGKTAPGKHLVTLCKTEDEKTMITLFLLERAWTLSTITPEEKIKEMEEQKTAKEKTFKRELDTGQVLPCPICSKKHRLIHIETEKSVRHKLKKT